MLVFGPLQDDRYRGKRHCASIRYSFISEQPTLRATRVLIDSRIKLSRAFCLDTLAPRKIIHALLPPSSTMEDSVKFSGIWALSQAFLISALVVRPSPYRWILFLPIASISVYLLFCTSTGNITRDDIVGSVILAYLFIASDYILLTDVQRDFHLIGQREEISQAPLSRRLRWGLRLFTSPRGVGWRHEPTASLAPHPKTTSRITFVAYQMMWTGAYILVFDLVGIFNRWNLALAKDSLIDDGGWSWRLRIASGFFVSAIAQTSLLYTIISATFVACCLSEPRDWPHLYGRWEDAYTLRRFWR